MIDIFRAPAPLQTAVLFLVFNRPDATAQVFEAIRKAQPPRLYVVADGPRTGRSVEAGKVAKVREIATKVDWPCEVKTLFREENLGCKYSVSGGITWFFEQEEQGIILEDDCLPSQSFFWFCELILEKYVNTKNIWMVSGFNPRHPGETTSSCFLSQNPSVWGWASWRDRWNQYDVGMSSWKPNCQLGFKEKVPRYVVNYYKKAFKKTKNGQIDTWDYQLSFLILMNNGFIVKPYCNLISNIGVDGTHANKKDINHYVELGSYVSKNECDCKFDFEEDLFFYKTRIKPSIWSIVFRIIRKIKRLIH